MRIRILLDEQFPNGMAAANRALLYAKGLTETGNDVLIVIPRATELAWKVKNTEVNGIHEGVRYRYAFESVIRKSFMGRRYQNFVSFLNLFLILLRSRPEIILFAAKDIKYIILVKTCSLLTGTKIVREKSEAPFYRVENLSWFMKFRIKSEFRLFDGMIVISGALDDFFHRELKMRIPTIEVPIMVDRNSISLKSGLDVKRENLVYTGSLLDHKDGVLTIIKAFRLISNKHPGVRLIMTGNIEGSIDRNEILTTIKNLKLSDSVELPGYLSRDKLNELTTTAYALLLAKPLNRQNRYNMATKVGEYLLTGRPAVISSVDPVCRYLRHRETACVTDPDEQGIAEEIEFLLDDPGKAEAIGLAGRDSGIRLFDYKLHAPRLLSFFRSL